MYSVDYDILERYEVPTRLEEVRHTVHLPEHFQQLARWAGIEISKEMWDVNDSRGYINKRNPTNGHINWQNDTLGKALEIATCLALGGHVLQDMVLAERKEDKGKNSPDVFGVYETRRKEEFGKPIIMKQKDHNAKAIVIMGHVEHVCLQETRTVELLGPVHLIGWVDADQDWCFAKNYFDDFTVHSSHIKPMEMLPLVNGAKWDTNWVGV